MTHRLFVRIAVSAALIGSAFIALAPAAYAQVKKPEAVKVAPAKAAPAKAAPTKPAATAAEGQPTQLGAFGSWNVYASDTANGRVCYALGKPKDRAPNTLKFDPGYFFVSSRPRDHVRDEISVTLGFLAKDGTDAQLVVGKSIFVAILKSQDTGSVAWLKSDKDTVSIIEQMKKTPTLLIKATSKRGNLITQSFNLEGFAQALDQVKKACP